MTKNHMVDSVLALTMGTGIGLLLSVFGQKLLNKHYIANCHKQADHNLIYIDSFLGDAYYCVKNAEFKQN